MTLIGKLLVLCNLVLSVAAAIAALMLYANSVDYTDNPAKDQKDKPDVPAGKQWAPTQEIKKLAQAGLVPQRAYEARLGELLDLEERRAADRPWYAEKIRHQREGATEEKPVEKVEFDEKGELPALDPSNFNRPKLAEVKGPDGKGLAALSTYAARIKDNRDALVKLYEAMQVAIDSDMKLTKQLVGEEGLRLLLAHERIKKTELLNEGLQVGPLLKITEISTNDTSQIQDRLQEQIRNIEQNIRNLEKQAAAKP